MSQSFAQNILSETLKKDFSVVNFVRYLVEDAFCSNVSDIHLHPTEKNIRIRFRIDGLLRDVALLPSKFFPEVVARIKILSNLRIDEQKNSQDGRFRHVLSSTNGKNDFFDVRVSFVPTFHGESIVLRLLAQTFSSVSLSDLGFSDQDEEKILNCINKQSGMILVTGPTGSGKTTTLYTLIKMLNTKERSVVTIEDPIEYSVSDTKQIQTNPRVGLNFANGLRSILRQDPDIIMVGEIRDLETAQIAVNTALTGHLLLSTLHTIDSVTAIPRLLDMGVLSFLVASTLRLVIAQRLVRKICVNCKKEKVLSFVEIELFRKNYDYDLKKTWYGAGCEVCKFTGYLGRMVVCEVLVVNDSIRELIVSNSEIIKIKKTAIDSGLNILIKDGIKKVESGFITIEELFRCLNE